VRGPRQHGYSHECADSGDALSHLDVRQRVERDHRHGDDRSQGAGQPRPSPHEYHVAAAIGEIEHRRELECELVGRFEAWLLERDGHVARAGEVRNAPLDLVSRVADRASEHAGHDVATFRAVGRRDQPALFVLLDAAQRVDQLREHR